MGESFAQFAARVLGFERQLTDPELERVVAKVGKTAQKIAADTVDADIGGTTFSGWAKAPLATRTDYIGNGQTLLKPTPRSAGPWTVAESGRHMGNGSGFAGPGVNRKSGETSRTKSGKLRKVRARARSRWNGYTRPKHTATKALSEIEKRVPGVVDEGVAKAVREFFD